MLGIGFWTVLQAAALVTAGFGIWILARACWDYAGLPEFQDRYLQLVEDRLQDPEMEHAANRQESGYLRRLRRSLQARPSPAARAASQEALLQLLNRPSLAPGLQPSAGDELTGLAVAVAGVSYDVGTDFAPPLAVNGSEVLGHPAQGRPVHGR